MIKNILRKNGRIKMEHGYLKFLVIFYLTSIIAKRRLVRKK